MVERWAIIENGVVTNICAWDGNAATWQPPEGATMIEAPDDIGAGFSYDGKTWTPPVSAPDPEPQTLAIVVNGVVTDIVEATTVEFIPATDDMKIGDDTSGDPAP